MFQTGWASWSWFRIISWPVGGITAHEPHKTHPSKTPSSRLRLKYGMKSGPGSDNVQLTWTNLLTQDKTRSLSVHALMWLAVMIHLERWLVSKIRSRGTGTDEGLCGSGKRLRPSAWAILLPGLCRIVYLYAPNVSARWWIREDAITGLGFLTVGDLNRY